MFQSAWFFQSVLPFWWTRVTSDSLCIDGRLINYVYQKLEGRWPIKYDNGLDVSTGHFHRFCGSLTPPPPIRIIGVLWSDALSWGEASVIMMLYDTCFIFINTISLIDNNDTLSYGSVCLFINFLYNHHFLWLIKLRAASHPRLFPIFSSESMADTCKHVDHYKFCRQLVTIPFVWYGSLYAKINKINIIILSK